MVDIHENIWELLTALCFSYSCNPICIMGHYSYIKIVHVHVYEFDSVWHKTHTRKIFISHNFCLNRLTVTRILMHYKMKVVLTLFVLSVIVVTSVGDTFSLFNDHVEPATASVPLTCLWQRAPQNTMSWVFIISFTLIPSSNLM